MLIIVFPKKVRLKFFDFYEIYIEYNFADRILNLFKPHDVP